jgi:hypothetical protein
MTISCFTSGDRHGHLVKSLIIKVLLLGARSVLLSASLSDEDADCLAQWITLDPEKMFGDPTTAFSGRGSISPVDSVRWKNDLGIMNVNAAIQIAALET